MKKNGDFIWESYDDFVDGFSILMAEFNGEHLGSL